MPKLILLDHASKEPLYMQLYRHFRTEIEQNNLKEDNKIPSIRGLADSLSISKITVEKAYQQLLCEGYIKNGNRTRYAVNRFVESSWPDPVPAVALPAESSTVEVPLRYDLASGEMDMEGFDFVLWKRYINKAFMDQNRLMRYGDLQGEAELRRQIVGYIRSRGVNCHHKQVIVGPGVQSLLNMLASILKPCHDGIAFEEPGFKIGRRIWEDRGFRIIPVGLRREGIDTDELAGSGARLVYVTPSHQFPTGYIMPIGERIRLLNWAGQTGATIIEDDYDSEFRYFGRPLPALKGLDTEGAVIYMGSFSKVIPPSIRISYMVLPDRLLEIYQKRASLYNQATSTIEQVALARYMADGHLERQIRRLRKLYNEKHALFLDNIRTMLGQRVEINETESGLHMVLTVKSNLTPNELYDRALLKGCRIALLQDYYLGEAPVTPSQIILYFSKIPAAEMPAAIRLLKEAWF
ncbi:HTH-type transcriptional regulatory protein GabR [Sporomusa rhizae]|uniref:MocR-like pyridoxine biosynthesis transcription factor PdxR n=1 Tax=Sporomusa rhizae TaxID=357999 RepID=UPI00352BC89A